LGRASNRQQQSQPHFSALTHHHSRATTNLVVQSRGLADGASVGDPALGDVADAVRHSVQDLGGGRGGEIRGAVERLGRGAMWAGGRDSGGGVLWLLGA